MLSATEAIECLDRASMQRDGHLEVFWLTYEGERDAFRDAVAACRGHRCIAVVVLRLPLFQSPNAMAQDIRALCEAHRAEIEETAGGAQDGGIRLLVISRTELGIPNSSSPVVVPDWFPRRGGTLIDSSIIDLLRAPVALLDGPQANIVGIRQATFELEGAFLRRLEKIGDEAEEFWKIVIDADEQHLGPAELMRHAARLRHSTSISAGFRPSLGRRGGIVGRLAKIAASHPIKDWGMVGRRVTGALGVRGAGGTIRSSLCGVLVGSPVPEYDEEMAIGREVLVLVYCVYRWLVAAGHPAEYPAFSPGLLRATSSHLIENCGKLARILDDR